MQTNPVSLARPLRWLTLADTPPDPDSGASGTDVQTVRALRDLGHEVDDVWSDAISHRWKHGNLHYALELPRSYRDVVRARLALKQCDVVLASQPHAYLAARWVRKHAPSVIFLNRSHGWETNATEALKVHRKRLGVPRWRFPRGLLGRPLAGLLNQHCQWAADASHGIVVYASSCAEHIVRRHKIEPWRIVRVPPAPPQSYKDAAVPSWASRPRGSVLLVSTASFFKGIHDSLAIIQQAAEANTGFSFTWVVESSAHARLRRALCDVANRTLTLLEPMDQLRLRKVYDNHRCFLFPSLYEGFGKAFLEAMSRGCCVVATNVGGMHDVIEHGKTGLLAYPGNQREMLDHLRELDSNHDLGQKLSLNSVSTANSFSWTSGAEALTRFASELRTRFDLTERVS